MQSLVEHLGIAVRQLREQHGWSQEQLAAMKHLPEMSKKLKRLEKKLAQYEKE